MKKVFIGAIFAAVGILSAIVIHCSFMIVEVEGSDMLPTLEPGQKVAIFLLTEEEDIQEGDIIAYWPRTYTVNGGNGPLLRRVESKGEEGYIVACDGALATESSMLIDSKDILGKAIIYG